MASSDLIWQLVKRHNAFQVKKNGTTLSSEPGNLLNINSPKYSGLSNSRTVDITAKADKSVVITLKSTNVNNVNRPKVAHRRVVLKNVNVKRDFGKVANTIKRTTSHQGYRPDLERIALARWTLLHRSLKGVKKSTKTHKRVKKVVAVTEKK